MKVFIHALNEFSITHKLSNFIGYTLKLFLMQNKISFSTSDLKSLIKAKEKYYYDAIKNNVAFDKIKAIQESINELKALLPKRRKRDS